MRRIVISLMMVLLVGGCEEKVQPSLVPLTQTDLPSQESWQSRVLFTDSARTKAVLWAGHIAVYSDQRYTLMDDSIHVDFFNEHEQHTSVLTARRGKVNDVTQDFEAYEHVVVVSDSGVVLRTERLFWTSATRKIHTDTFVDIVSQSEHIMGQGMQSDAGLKNYEIFKVTGQVMTHE